jgi:exopolysaccharide production protein ExoQ
MPFAANGNCQVVKTLVGSVMLQGSDHKSGRSGIALIAQQVASWMLVVTLVFFSGHGRFSFLSASDINLTGLAASSGFQSVRQFSLLESLALPLVAYSLVLWLIISHIRSVLSVAIQMKTMTFLSLMTVCSALWSQDPVRSTYNGLLYLICTLFAYYVIACVVSSNVRTVTMRTGVVVCLLGLFLVVFFPKFGLSDVEVRTAGAWRGIFIDRTAAGKCLTFLLSPALVFGYRTVTWRRLAYIALLLTSLVMARAATALIVVALYVLFMVGLRYAQCLERRTASVLGIAAVTGLLVFVLCATPFIGDFVGMFGRDITLTGRTAIWGLLTPPIYRHPVLGYGFYAFWLGLRGESGNVIREAHWFFGYAHNGMLEIILQLGVVGLTLFLTTFFHAVKDALLCYRERVIGVDWYIGIIFITVLYNIDESTVLWPTDLLSILYVVACCGLSITARRIRAGSAALPI